MPITFQSIDDPYGIRAGGSALAQAMMQKNMENLQNRRQIEAEQRQQAFLKEKEARALEQNKVRGSALASALDNYTGENKEEFDALSFMKNALNAGASVEDVMNASRMMASKTSAKAAPKTQYEQVQAKDNMKYLSHIRQQAQTANDLLRVWPDLEKAINDPSLENQSDLTRMYKAAAAKMPIGQGVTLNEPEQAIASYSKQIITGITDLKGIRLSDAKLKWLANATVEVGKTPEANRKAAQINKDFLQIQSLRAPIAEQIIRNNDNEIPANIQEQVEGKLSEIADQYIEQNMKMDKGAVGGELEKMPPAKGNKGMEIEDESGNVFVSDGERWKKKVK